MSDFALNDGENAGESFSSPDRLAEALRKNTLGSFRAESDLAACLLPLLQALKWANDLREVTESLPHFADTLDLAEFRNVLARLNFKTVPLKTDLAKIDSRLFPSIIVDEQESANILLARQGNIFKIFHGASREIRRVPHTQLKGVVYLVAEAEVMETEEKLRKENWMGDLLLRFKETLTQIAILTFVLNMLVLSVPLFVMAIYDQVVPARSIPMLQSLGAAMVFILAIEYMVRTLRSRFVAFLGGRLEYLIATNTFRQVLSLPPALTENAPLSGQVSRLREFDTIREVFTGPLVSVVMEIPFVLIFIVVIAALGGIVALVPIFMIFLYILASLILLPRLRRQATLSARARADRHSFLVEMVSNMRTIKETGAEETWQERYRELSAEASFKHFKTSQTTFMFQTIGQTIMTAAGIATITLGVFQVLDGLMTIGALIASMALVWRVLTPLQSMFLTFSRFEQIKTAIKQINQLMRMARENDQNKPNNTESVKRNFQGFVSFIRVSFRYNPAAEPALLGINFELKAKEFLAITGPNGAGKSTLMRLILGLQNPQAGQVNVDGLDIRQINPIELRQTIAYVPQDPSLFHGSITQNLRLAYPVATDDEIYEACKKAGCLKDIMDLPEKFETRMGDNKSGHYSAGFVQKLYLARVYLQNAPIILLDEPAQTLDDVGDKAFVEALKKLKGTTTIIMISHRPSHLRLADRLLVLQGGIKVLEGAPDAVLERLKGANL
jgi:ATP-binding cassette subfamily C protein/ATP-binding cassette subfamily C protein LapB